MTRARETTDLNVLLPRLVIDWHHDDPSVLHKSIQGSLVFADISGFTALSERLARQGRVGAEEVTDLIGSTFSKLLSSAYSAGGTLLKFGGDALLIFFSEEGHAARAARAANSMRHELRDIGPIKTSAGSVQLRMSIGVNTGKFHFFLVGQIHKELLLAGKATTETVKLEHAAESGEIIVGKETAASLDAAELGVEKSGGVLLKRNPVRLHIGGFSPVRQEPLPDVYFPLSLRKELTGGGGYAEHRQVSFAFVRLMGLDHPVETDAAATSRLLDEAITFIQKISLDHEVTFLGSDVDEEGAKILLTTGAPQSFGNDEERLLRATKEVVTLDCGIEISAGVHRGHAFSGLVGPSFRRTYAVMGDPVNTAARIAVRAPGGVVLATADVLERSRSVFETNAVEPFAAKGKSKPISAYKVGRLRGARRADATRLPFVGRESELEFLAQALGRAEKGDGGSIDLVGEPGIGKTRLIEEISERSDSVMSVRANIYETSTPYFVFRHLLRKALGFASKPTSEELLHRVSELDSDLIPWLPLIGMVMDVGVESTSEVDALHPAFKAAKVQQTVEQLLRAVTPAPCLVFIDDGDHLDPDSSTLIDHLGKTTRERPWLIVVARRTDRGDELLKMTLRPLKIREAMKLARSASVAPMLPQEARALVTRSGGNPLFTEQVVQAWMAGRELDTIPDSLEAEIGVRIDRLPPAKRALLRTLSVLGSTFDEETAGAITRSPFDVELLSGDIAEFIRSTQEGFEFLVPLYQEAAYAGLPFRRRKVIHRRVAEFLESTRSIEESAPLLSMHFHLGDELRKSLHFSRLAAEAAERKYAWLAAESFYRRALDAARRSRLKDNALLSDTWEKLGFVLHNGGRIVDASFAYSRSRSLARDNLSLARLWHREGGVREQLGEFDRAYRAYRRGIASLVVDAQVPETRERYARLLLGCASVRRHQGKLGEAKSLALQAVAEAEPASDLQTLGHAYNLLLTLAFLTGEPGGEELGRRALAAWEAEGDLREQGNVLNNLATPKHLEGEWQAALELYRRSRDAFLRAGNTVYAAAVGTNIAEILADRGETEEGRTLVEDSINTFRAAGIRRLVFQATSVLGKLAAKQGRLSEARALYEEALAGFAEIGTKGHTTSLRLAELDLQEGQARKALRAANEMIEGSSHLLAPALLRIKGEAFAATGDFISARAVLTEGHEKAMQANQLFEAALSMRALARIDRQSGSDGEDLAAGADEIFKKLGVKAPN